MSNNSKRLSFNNSPKLKQEYLDRLEIHRKNDEIIHGTYWQDGKGCAIGCTVLCKDNNSYHKQLENELDVPEWLWQLEDTLFENLKNDKAKDFVINFFHAIQVGITQERFQSIYHKFCVFLLEDICKDIDNPIVLQAISNIIILHKTESKDKLSWSTARSAATALAAYSVAASEADLAARSAAASAVDLAADSAADLAARSAATALVAYSAAYSATAPAAWSAARLAAHERISEKIIQLLKEQKVNSGR